MGRRGLEPRTYGLKVRSSTIELATPQRTLRDTRRRLGSGKHATTYAASVRHSDLLNGSNEHDAGAQWRADPS